MISRGVEVNNLLLLEAKFGNDLLVFQNRWVKVFKNGPNKICGRQPLKSLKQYVLPYHFKFFKGSLPQILLGPLLNALTQMFMEFRTVFRKISVMELIFSKIARVEISAISMKRDFVEDCFVVICQSFQRTFFRLNL